MYKAPNLGQSAHDSSPEEGAKRLAEREASEKLLGPTAPELRSILLVSQGSYKRKAVIGRAISRIVGELRPRLTNLEQWLVSTF